MVAARPLRDTGHDYGGERSRAVLSCWAARVAEADSRNTCSGTTKETTDGIAGWRGSAVGESCRMVALVVGLLRGRGARCDRAAAARNRSHTRRTRPAIRRISGRFCRRKRCAPRVTGAHRLTTCRLDVEAIARNGRGVEGAAFSDFTIRRKANCRHANAPVSVRTEQSLLKPSPEMSPPTSAALQVSR